jgi:hypothetical protein
LVASDTAHHNLSRTIDALNIELAGTKRQLRLILKNAHDPIHEFSELRSSSVSGLADFKSLIWP